MLTTAEESGQSGRFVSSGREKNDPEYDLRWGPHARYVYDECVAILTDGGREPVSPKWEQFARQRARAEQAAEERASLSS